jgi:CRISPR-associated protein Cmr2
VAVADRFDLIELQYGLEPMAFWLDDYLAAWQDGEARRVLEAYYGRADNEAQAKAAFFMRKAFGELATSLALKRFRRREGNKDERGRQPVVQFETIPYLRRCHSCDHRGAVIYIPLRDEYLCEPCARKKVVGDLAKKIEENIEWFTERFAWSPEDVHPWYESFVGFLKKNAQLAASYYGDFKGDPDNPRDLNEIGQAAKPGRFIGLVYGDGNNVGALIEKIRTPAEYRQFAQKLFEATKNAVFRALAENLKPTQIRRRSEDGRREWEQWIHPFEIISIGGDDVFLIVPGDKALPIARDIARYLEEAFQSRHLAIEEGFAVHRYRPPDRPQPVTPEPQPAISLSAGVVVAGENTPIFFLHDLVTALLKSAKGKAKELKEQGYRGGTLDFLILKAIPMVTTELTDFREAAYLVELPKACLCLTARPYTLIEMDGLLKAAKALKRADFPRTQLYAMRRYTRLGRMTATVNYLYFRIRSRASEVLNRAFDLPWHRQPELVPWRQVTTDDKETWETSLLDLVEIYDFVAEE